jgi:hypothetical protein
VYRIARPAHTAANSTHHHESKPTLTPDTINALFEGFGALFLFADCHKLQLHKELRGVYWPGRVFWALWGLWNVFYYPAIGQPLSFAMGVSVLAANVLWCALAIRYRNR